MTHPTPFFLALVATIAACHGSAPASGAAASADAADTIHKAAPTSPDTGAFEAIGYLIPDSAYQLADYDLANIPLGMGVIELQRGGPDSTTRYDCPNGIVTRDTLNLSCPNTPLGTILIQGKLVDAFGHVIGQSAQFAWLTVSVIAGQRVVLSRRMRFTFTYGD